MTFTLASARLPISIVVQQHADEAAHLRATRSFLVRAPHAGLLHLARLDERIAAHLDGLSVAGAPGREICTAALASPGPGELFAAASSALEAKDTATLDKLLALAESLPAAQAGLISAFGWAPAASLRGITGALLTSASAFQRQVALAACAMHHVDPGTALTEALTHADAQLRARALRVAAQCGRVDLLPACLALLTADDPTCHYQAARAALLLGDRVASVAALLVLARSAGARQSAALALVLKVLAPTEAHALLKALAQDENMLRAAIRGIGTAGDVHYVPWLLKQMNDPQQARVAGESFSLITGLDLAYLDLDRQPPEDFELGPSDDPEDSAVAMEEDDNLPWPDPHKLAAWWQTNSHRFVAGTRNFMGEPPTPTHCVSVLGTAFQRQRMAAAEYLCLLRPGTPLFNTAAPAWRQQRALAQMIGERDAER